MPVDVRTEIVINQPCAVVAAFAMDPDNAPQWYENIKSVEWLSDRPVRVGSRIAFVAHFRSRRIAYTHEVTEPSATLLRMQTADGPFLMETTYELDAVDDDRCPCSCGTVVSPRDSAASWARSSPTQCAVARDAW